VAVWCADPTKFGTEEARQNSAAAQQDRIRPWGKIKKIIGTSE